MAQTVNDLTLEALVDDFSSAASALPDPRKGTNKRYSVTDAAAAAFAAFFFQDRSFLAFQKRMEHSAQCSNCQTLFDIRRIPTDNTIRNLLDGAPTDLFDDLFPHCLEILADHGALEPFERLDGRLLIAIDGIEIQKSYKIHCPHCSTRHVGTSKTPQYFHSMIGPAIVADDHNRVIPLMPEFIEPQQDPAAEDTELTGERQKQDCERNAAKRWISKHAKDLAAYRPGLPRRRPVLLPSHLPAHSRPRRRLHSHLQAQLPQVPRGLSPRLPDPRHRLGAHAQCQGPGRGAPLSLAHAPAGARRGGRRRGHLDRDDRPPPGPQGTDPEPWKQVYHNTFFTSLEVTADNVAEIARAGRARWKVENETYNCLTRQGYSLKHNFGHGQDGLANLLTVLNLLAFAFHSVLDCLSDLWRRARVKLGTRRAFFEHLRVAARLILFPHWTAVLEALLADRALLDLTASPTSP